MTSIYIVAAAALAVFGWRCVQRFRHYLDQSIEAETDMPMAYRSAMFAAVLSWLISFLAVMGLSFLIQHLLAETSYQDIVNAVFGVMLLGLVATNLCLLYEVMRVAWRWKWRRTWRFMPSRCRARNRESRL